MENDLISRSALKETILNICGKCSNVIREYDEHGVPDGNCAIQHIMNMIDNAPTVEQPQGEWGKWIIAEIQCPKCYRYTEVDYYSAEELNKCPKCGAKMRGEE